MFLVCLVPFIGRVITYKCPSCNDDDDKLESMPISYDEVYKFDYDQKRGIILEFSKSCR